MRGRDTSPRVRTCQEHLHLATFPHHHHHFLPHHHHPHGHHHHHHHHHPHLIDCSFWCLGEGTFGSAGSQQIYFTITVLQIRAYLLFNGCVNVLGFESSPPPPSQWEVGVLSQLFGGESRCSEKLLACPRSHSCLQQKLPPVGQPWRAGPCPVPC